MHAMAWDSSRPVPWQRLIREWLIYVAIMAAVLLLLFRDANVIGAYAGLLISGPLYLGVGFVMAKFGYQRKTLKEMRTPQAKAESSTSSDDPERPSRSKPAPTKRTSGGGNRPKSKPRRR